MPTAPSRRSQNRGVLDDLLGVPAPEAEPPPAAAPAGPAAAASGAPPPATAPRLTLCLPPALIERARDCVFHSPGFTLSSLAAEAIGREIDRLEELRGQPFPARHGPVRTGRPIR